LDQAKEETLVWKIFPRHSAKEPKDEDQLLAVLRPIGPRVRSAMLAAAMDGPLERRSWKGCPLNRAAQVLGEVVADQRSAVDVLALSSETVRQFVWVWDRLEGNPESCTARLRQAITALDFVPGGGPAQGNGATSERHHRGLANR
jgi:hypothetical protein